MLFDTIDGEALPQQSTLPFSNVDRIRISSKHRVKPPRQGRTKPYGHHTKHHYHVLVCPHCGKAIASDYRVRHTYLALRNWLCKQFGLRRFFAKRLAKQLVIHQNEVIHEEVGRDKTSSTNGG